MAGSPTDRELLDTDPNLFEIHKSQKAQFKELQTVCIAVAIFSGMSVNGTQATDTNISIIEAGLEYGVRVYAFSPCIVCEYSLLIDKYVYS